jgi:hypothetical protein
MLIRDNDGEIIGEMNTIFTQGRVRREDEYDAQQRMSGRSKRNRSRHAGQRSHNKCDRRENSALIGNWSTDRG